MSLWTRNRILEAMQDSEDDSSLRIYPLLSDKQIGEVSIDIRLGYDFLVSILNRHPTIQIRSVGDGGARSAKEHFQETRREIGDSFVLYPNQLVLGTSIEYFAMPSHVYAEISPRSSYARLGLAVGGIMQPGFRGCIPLELLNHGNVPVELTVGARICQIQIIQFEGKSDYHAGSASRKYFGQVRPMVSMAAHDEDLARLMTLPRVIRAPSSPGHE
jgi:dCTP deaminase